MKMCLFSFFSTFVCLVVVVVVVVVVVFGKGVIICPKRCPKRNSIILVLIFNFFPNSLFI